MTLLCCLNQVLITFSITYRLKTSQSTHLMVIKNHVQLRKFQLRIHKHGLLMLLYSCLIFLPTVHNIIQQIFKEIKLRLYMWEIYSHSHNACIMVSQCMLSTEMCSGPRRCFRSAHHSLLSSWLCKCKKKEGKRWNVV